MNVQVEDVWAEAEHVRPLNSWKEFEKHVRIAGYPLLARLDDFKDAILVAGCQRSGTTMLAKVITESEGIRNFWFGVDPCMDGGLLLSGYLPHEPVGRYCFQTTRCPCCLCQSILARPAVVSRGKSNRLTHPSKNSIAS